MSATVPPRGRYLAALTLGALGIVYGDIGTSPLYALKECFHGLHGVPPTRDNVLGVLSLIFWALMLIVSRQVPHLRDAGGQQGRGRHPGADGAGARRARRPRRGSRVALIALGLFGAALLYGDGMITPAISVLGAVEGLNVATHVFEPFVVPVTVVILFGLFLIAVARHARRRDVVRPRDGRVVRQPRRARDSVDHPRAPRARRVQSARRRAVPLAQRLDRASLCSGPCSSC